MRDGVKTALRISHNRLDSEIDRTIAVARAELIRAGVPVDCANNGGILISEAIITYCLYQFSPADNERFFESFLYQCDNLRKSAVIE